MKKGLTPLPLDTAVNPRNIPKLSAVAALGFPLGSRTQQAEINALEKRLEERRKRREADLASQKIVNLNQSARE